MLRYLSGALMNSVKISADFTGNVLMIVKAKTGHYEVEAQSRYLIANIDVDSILQVVQSFLEVPGPSRSQITGIYIRLQEDGERGRGWFVILTSLHDKKNEYR